MKAKSASLTMYHVEEGRHREVLVWHDQDHKPEVVGTTPHIFISQRWVATPDLMEARPPSSLEFAGGEYLNLYWSAGTAKELEENFKLLDARLRPIGRMEPMQYMRRTWGDRLLPVSGQIRPGLELSVEGVTCAPQTSGLMVVLETLRDSDQRAEYERWVEVEQMPRVLHTGLFSGAVRFQSGTGANGDLSAVFYYTDHADPLAAYREFRDLEAGWTGFPDADSAPRPVHSGMYKPSMGFYDYYA